MNARSPVDARSLSDFVAATIPDLERALVARFGAEHGREAAAEVAAYAVAHWDRLQPMDNPVGYLFRVGQTAARRLRRWQRPDLVWPNPLTAPEPVDVDLQRALMRLKPEQRLAVMLTIGFGLSHHEVAAILSTSASNVANHVSRGLARLRKLVPSP